MNATWIDLQIPKFMYIMVKLMKAKERILKTAIEKKLIAFNRIIMKASRQWKEIFSSLTKKKTKKQLSNNFLPEKMILQKPRRKKIDVLDFIKTIMIHVYV